MFESPRRSGSGTQKRLRILRALGQTDRACSLHTIHTLHLEMLLGESDINTLTLVLESFTSDRPRKIIGLSISINNKHPNTGS